MPSRTVFLLASLLASIAWAQRPVGDVEPLTHGTLESLLYGQSDTVSRCASQNQVQAYLLAVSVRVTGHASPSTLWDASIAVSVRSRPRDPDFERCVSRDVREALRHEPYDVGPRSLSARHTFQVGEGPQPPIPTEARPYSEQEVHQTLSSNSYGMQQCLQVAGIPEEVTLRVSVRPDGRLVLTSADVPPGAGGSALTCLASQVSSMRVAGRPSRAVTVVHRLPVSQH